MEDPGLKLRGLGQVVDESTIEGVRAILNQRTRDLDKLYFIPDIGARQLRQGKCDEHQRGDPGGASGAGLGHVGPCSPMSITVASDTVLATRGSRRNW